MTILIIEDEPLAAERLQSLLLELDHSFTVTKVIDSVKESVSYLKISPTPDLIFMDIMLADGQSFEIFEQVDINAPIIFTTAHDDFALKAFKVNSVDYLLKPIDPLLLKQSLKKFDTINRNFHELKGFFQSLLIKENAAYKGRFLVKSGETYTPVIISDIACFSYEDKLTFLYTNTGKRFMLDYSLDELEAMLDPKLFFRLNRQYLSSFSAIKSVHNYFNSKLKVYLFPEIADGITVSKERAPGLKVWLDL
jgi:DNA-binding LytR/AlgR family response regulator